MDLPDLIERFKAARMAAVTEQDFHTAVVYRGLEDFVKDLAKDPPSADYRLLALLGHLQLAASLVHLTGMARLAARTQPRAFRDLSASDKGADEDV